VPAHALYPESTHFGRTESLSAQPVHTQRFSTGLLPHEQSILRVLLYFNIFDHPLTVEEIFSFLPSERLSLEDLGCLLRSGSLMRFVRSRGKYFFLHTTSEACVEERLEKERLAERRVRTAFLVARVIRAFPFVRAVMLSGELSKGVASRNSDIDFVIVTRRRRLWISRTILIFFKKIFLFNSKKFFCLNYFISEDRLDVDLRNIYSATEIATLKPLSNVSAYAEYIGANGWIRSFFPNWTMSAPPDAGKNVRESRAQRILESLVPERLGDRIDSWLLDRWRILWSKRYPDLTEEERHHKFRSDVSLSTAYGNDFQQKVLAQYSYRLRHYGIANSEAPN
jgi:hypothetical protein